MMQMNVSHEQQVHVELEPLIHPLMQADMLEQFRQLDEDVQRIRDGLQVGCAAGLIEF